MFILRDIFGPLQSDFSSSRPGKQRSRWFVYAPWLSLFRLLRPSLRTFFGA